MNILKKTGCLKIVFYVVLGIIIFVSIDVGYSYIKTLYLASKPNALQMQILHTEKSDITNDMLNDIGAHDMYKDMPEKLHDAIRKERDSYGVIRISYTFYAGVDKLQIWDIKCIPQIDGVEILYYTKGDGHAPIHVNQKVVRDLNQYVFYKKNRDIVNDKSEEVKAEISYQLGYDTYQTIKRYKKII